MSGVIGIAGIKVISDGTVNGTRVLYKATGEDLTQKMVITRIVWTLDAELRPMPTCELTVAADVELVTNQHGVGVIERRQA